VESVPSRGAAQNCSTILEHSVANGQSIRRSQLRHKRMRQQLLLIDVIMGCHRKTSMCQRPAAWSVTKQKTVGDDAKQRRSRSESVGVGRTAVGYNRSKLKFWPFHLFVLQPPTNRSAPFSVIEDSKDVGALLPLATRLPSIIKTSTNGLTDGRTTD
jgi:hypothetical protein